MEQNYCNISIFKRVVFIYYIFTIHNFITPIKTKLCSNQEVTLNFGWL